MHYLYIIKSKVKHTFYIGITTDIQKRLKKHNAGGNKSTKPYKPWIIVYTEHFITKRDAIIRENISKTYRNTVYRLAILV